MGRAITTIVKHECDLCGHTEEVITEHSKSNVYGKGLKPGEQWRLIEMRDIPNYESSGDREPIKTFVLCEKCRAGEFKLVKA